MKQPNQVTSPWSWGFKTWANESIQKWIESYEPKIKNGDFLKEKGLTEALSFQVDKAKEELANRLIRGTL